MCALLSVSLSQRRNAGSSPWFPFSQQPPIAFSSLQHNNMTTLQHNNMTTHDMVSPPLHQATRCKNLGNVFFSLLTPRLFWAHLGCGWKSTFALRHGTVDERKVPGNLQTSLLLTSGQISPPPPICPPLAGGCSNIVSPPQQLVRNSWPCRNNQTKAWPLFRCANHV